MTEPYAPRRRNARRAIAWITGLIIAAGVLTVVPRAGEAQACDRLWISSIRLERCVVSGGQSQIDAGNVVRMDALSSDRLHWLAGHRTSHGGTFGSLPSMQVGAAVDYRGTTYRVDEYRLVNRFQPNVIDWLTSPDDGLVLQTSAFGSYVHTWHATPADARPDPGPQGPEPTAPVGDATAITIVDPVRVLDTRRTVGTLPSGSTLEAPIPSSAGIPLDATLAFVNVTAIGRGGMGYLTVYECDQDVPSTSSVNWSDDQPVANLVVAPLSGRSFCLRNVGDVDVAVDVVGYGSATSSLGFVPVDGVRLLDTRHADVGPFGPLETVRVDATGPGSAALVTLSAKASQRGFVSAHPCDADPYAASSLNPFPGSWTANAVLVPLDDDGGFCVSTNFPAGAVDLLVDLQGTFDSDGSLFQPMRPARLVDTRRTDPGLSRGTEGHRAAGTIAFPGRGLEGAPDHDGLIINVTVARPAESGYTSVWACDRPKPSTSVQNSQPGRNTAAAASVATGSEICVEQANEAHVIVDLVGLWVHG